MQTFQALYRTRMFTPGFKLFAGIATVGMLGAFFFGVTSNGKDVKDNLVDSVFGPLTFGWKGEVGNHAGYVVLVSLFVAAAFLAGLLVAFRDADPEAGAEYIESDSVPLTRAPYGTSYWPLAAGFSVCAMVLGLVTNMAVFWAGVLVLVAVAGVWTFRAWAERATGDDEVNQAIYDRIIDPIRLPFTALVCIAVIALGMSRVILAAPSKTSSTLIFLVVGAALFGLFLALAFFPEIGKKALPAVVVIGAVLFIGAGIFGAAAGERDMSHHGPSTGAEAGPAGEHGLGPTGAPSPIATDGATR